MKIEYIKHSCFLITTQQGVKILIDPVNWDRDVSPNLRPDVILLSHQHSDHSNLSLAGGAAEIIYGAGSHFVSGVPITGFTADHGEHMGKWLGMVVCYRIDIDGIRCLHLSDMGVLPSNDEIKEMSEDVDILFIPVGGVWTLDPLKASQLAEQIKPKIIIPMHYHYAGTPQGAYPLQPVDEFLKDKDKDKIKIFRESFCKLSLENLPQEEIWVITPMY